MFMLGSSHTMGIRAEVPKHNVTNMFKPSADLSNVTLGTLETCAKMTM
jgi:hypothetical protein